VSGVICLGLAVAGAALIGYAAILLGRGGSAEGDISSRESSPINSTELVLKDVGNFRPGKVIEFSEIARIWKDVEPGTEPHSGSLPPPLSPAGGTASAVVQLPCPAPARAAAPHPQGSRKPDKGFVPQLVELPWFDADACLAELRKGINRTDGKRWESVSMPDGLVYCNPDGLWRALKDAAPGNPAIAAAEADPESKCNILYSAVREFAEKRGAIASDMLESNRYLARVVIITGSGRMSHVSPLLIPFRAEQAFGVTAPDLEMEKSLAIRRMVASVKPKPGETAA
jgi:hypothetical protein